MKKFQSSLIVSIAVLVAFGITLYFILRHDSQEPEVSLGEMSLVQVETYTTPTEYAAFDVKYPQFKNASSAFNAKIKNTVTNAIAQHTSDSEENWKARYETQFEGDTISQFPTDDEKFQLYISYEPVQVNDEYISILLRIGGFTGGAHGYENLVSFNYDVKAQQELGLGDLFLGNPNYLKTVSDFSRTALTADFKKRLEVSTPEDETNFQEGVIPMMMDGTKPSAQNFSVFTFTPDSITIYFTQYQVAPYVLGESSVVMQRN